MRYEKYNKIFQNQMNKLNMFQGFQCGELSNAEWLEQRVAKIPSSVLIT